MLEEFHLAQALLRLGERLIAAEAPQLAGLRLLFSDNNILPADLFNHAVKYTKTSEFIS